MFLGLGINQVMKCHHKGCKIKMKVLKFSCKYCCSDFCLKHQLPEDHNCTSSMKEVVILPGPVVPSKLTFI